jgi:hypothetical protein
MTQKVGTMNMFETQQNDACKRPREGHGDESLASKQEQNFGRNEEWLFLC